MKNSTYKFVTTGSKQVLKINNRTIGYVYQTVSEGWAYCVGKPSDACVSQFTGKEKPLTEWQAKARLLNAAGANAEAWIIMFSDMARACKTVELFVENVRTVKDVPFHVSEEFYFSFAPHDDATIDQTAKIFFNISNAIAA